MDTNRMKKLAGLLNESKLNEAPKRPELLVHPVISSIKRRMDDKERIKLHKELMAMIKTVLSIQDNFRDIGKWMRGEPTQYKVKNVESFFQGVQKKIDDVKTFALDLEQDLKNNKR